VTSLYCTPNGTGKQEGLKQEVNQVLLMGGLIAGKDEMTETTES
jgi:hypothetical protein